MKFIFLIFCFASGAFTLARSATVETAIFPVTGRSLMAMIETRDLQSFSAALRSGCLSGVKPKNLRSIFLRLITGKDQEMMAIFMSALDQWSNRELIVNGIRRCLSKKDTIMAGSIMSAVAYGIIPQDTLEIMLEAAVAGRQHEAAGLLKSYGVRMESFDPSLIRDVETAYLFAAELYEFRSKKGENALFLFNKPAIVEYLLVAGLDPDAIDDDGNTLLMRTRSLEKARLLLSFGADVNLPGRGGRTPISCAKNPEMLELLLSYGADHEAVDRAGRTAIMMFRDLKMVEILLRAGADPLVKNSFGLSAFDMALIQGSEVLSLFLEHIEIPDGVDSFVAPEVIPATDLEILDRLLEQGLNINNKNRFGRNAAFYVKTLDQLKKMMSRGLMLGISDNYGRTAIFYPRPFDVLEHLLASGVNADFSDSNGNNPLGFATVPEVMKLLLDYGADPGHRNKALETPVFTLVRNSLKKSGAGKYTQQLIEMLLEHGADINAVNRYGRTPLMVCPSADLCDYLVNRGATEAPANKKKVNALFKLVANSGNIKGIQKLVSQGVSLFDTEKTDTLLIRCLPEYTQYLIDNGVYLEAKNNKGNTAMMHSAGVDKTGQKVSILLANGAMAETRNRSGETPLHFAVKACNVKALKILLEKISDVSPVNSNGATPLRTARIEMGKLSASIESIKDALEKKKVLQKIRLFKQCIEILLKNEAME
ncbi:MAG: ankyrin repeat domain-containing protein [Candidatus Wallbacteria bacterium]|nr:ankyrin repeat domain-containing protein [Candidatus Wallbacteria bacterium]